jgi:hypothetical protein
VLRIVRGNLIERGIKVNFAPDASVPPVAGDRIQLQQVLLNLMLNARDAAAPMVKTSAGVWSVLPAWAVSSNVHVREYTRLRLRVSSPAPISIKLLVGGRLGANGMIGMRCFNRPGRALTLRVERSIQRGRRSRGIAPMIQVAARASPPIVMPAGNR